ncbi:MAG TPA: hypothetical protein VE009_08375, partial [Paenibacillus sp.]|nr:hypothetical protein [Paenibacillus sp.]
GLNAMMNQGKVRLVWEPVLEGVSTYAIYRSDASGVGYAKMGESTTTEYLDTAIMHGSTYYYVVKAIDGKGAESEPSNEAMVTVEVAEVGWYEENHSEFVYEGRWLNHSNAGHSGGNVRYTESENASMTFTFRGTAVKIGSVLHPNHGIMDVYIDGTKAGSVDLYSSVSRNNQVVFEKTDLSDGVHTIKIVRTGIKNPAAMKATIAIDYVEVGGVVNSLSSDLTAEVKKEGILLNWSPLDPSLTYTLYRSTVSDSVYGGSYAITVTEATYMDNFVVEGETYSYVIVGTDSEGRTVYQSNEVTVVAGGNNGPRSAMVNRPVIKKLY